MQSQEGSPNIGKDLLCESETVLQSYNDEMLKSKGLRTSLFGEKGKNLSIRKTESINVNESE